MVLQEDKEVVQAAWLDWLGSEDSVTRDDHQKRGKMHPLVAKPFVEAICQRHCWWRQSCPKRCPINLSDHCALCFAGSAELNLHPCIPTQTPEGKETRWPLLHCLLISKYN